MAVKEKDKNPEPQATEQQRSGRDTMRWVVGLLTVMAGIFTVLSILSYFFHWKNDYSVLHAEQPDDADKFIENVCGPAGARIADALVGGSFGVFGILVAVIAIFIGVRIIRRRPMFFNHSTLSCMLVLILGSLTLGLAFGEQWGIFGSGWGGDFGIFVAKKIQSTIGLAGAILTLVCGWILTGVFININFINTVNHAGTAVADKGEAIWDNLLGVFKRRPKRTEFDDFLRNTEEETARREFEVEQVPAETFRPVKFEETEIKPEPEQQTEMPKESITETAFTEVEIEEENKTTETEPGRSFVEEFDEDRVAPYADSIFVETDEEIAEISDETAESDKQQDKGPQNESAGNGHSSKIFEEFEITNKSGDEHSADERTKIIVEEHHEKQVGAHEIGSLYDPTKDIHNYHRPSIDLLVDHSSNSHVSDEEITSNKQRIEETLASFGIPIRDMKATVGPTVTLYEIVQEQGVQISKIRKLDNDIAQSLKALGIRIIAPIPGRGTIGIEVPNQDKETVSMRSAILSKRFQQFEGELPVVIGRTIQNENYVFDLAKMPHLLVAGATGQGKSVGLNAIITSLLYRKHPSQLKFVMIDPKMVEFSLYARLEKHFLAKMESEEEVIITDPKKAVNTLQSLCIEMGNRLELCKKAAAKNIVEYNEKFLNRKLNPANGHYYMPYIVVVIDEFADLIMMAKEVEAPVMRLAQKARAIGIHLIIATQRPDVKVITGGIKANFPSRIAFRVMSMTDSRTIIDQPGANQLIGRGDMLFSKNGELTRIQCAFIDTPEVENIVDAIAAQNGYPYAYPLPDYEEAGSGIGSEQGGAGNDLGGGTAIKYDALFADIARAAVEGGQISTSYIQRNFEVGFNRAGRIMTQLERAGIVGPQIGAKPREIKFYDIQSLEAKLQDLGLF